MSYKDDVKGTAKRTSEKKYPIKATRNEEFPNRRFLAHIHGCILSIEDRSNSLREITFRCEHKTYDFTIGKTTYNLIGTLKPLVVFDAIIDVSLGTRLGLAVTTPEQYQLFEAFESLSEKLDGIRTWLSFSEDERSSVLAQRCHAAYPLVPQREDSNDPYRKMLARYQFTKRTYPERQQAIIDNIIRSSGNGGRSASHSLKKLEYLINISTASLNRRCSSYHELARTMDQMVHGQTKAKQRLLLSAVTSSKKAHHGFKAIIVGPTGFGKEALALAFAKGLGQPYEILPLAGLSSAVEVAGLDSSFEYSAPGLFADTFLQHGTTDMTLILTGLDHLGTGTNNGDPRHAISGLFKENAQLDDQYLDAPKDCRNSVIIATVESTRSLPEYLLSNATVIHLEPYTVNDKEQIVTQFIFPKLLHDFGIPANSVSFTRGALRRVVTETTELGMDGIRQNVETCAGVMSLHLQEHKEALAVIDEAFLDQCLTPFHHTDHPVYRFNKYQHLYQPEVKEAFLRACDELSDDQLDTATRRTLQRQLKILSALVPNPHAAANIDPSELRAKLDETHYGQVEVKNRLVNAIAAHSRRGASVAGIRFGFCGPAGSGKSSFGESLAKARSVPYIKLPLNGMVDPECLKGSQHNEGRVMAELTRVGTLSAVVLLDEVDKCGHLVSEALVDLLDDSSLFLDNFLGFPVRLDAVQFIATFNDASNVDPLVLDRLTLIEVPGYNLAEKSEIIKSYLLPSFQKQYALHSLTADDEVIRFLISGYCRSVCIRDAKKAVKTLTEALVGTHPEQDEFILTKEEITSVLGAPEYHDVVPTFNMPGCANALGVCGNYGLVFPVEVLLTEEEGLTTTGLAQEATQESVRVALAMIRHVFHQSKAGSGFHIHIGQGGIPKDGPSAGLAIAVAILSAILKIPVPSKHCFTGELDLYGNILPVGGIPTKIQAAFLSGCTRVFIPFGNMNEIDKRGIDSYPIEIISVSRVKEVVDAVFPGMFQSQDNGQ